MSPAHQRSGGVWLLLIIGSPLDPDSQVNQPRGWAGKDAQTRGPAPPVWQCNYLGVWPYLRPILCDTSWACRVFTSGGGGGGQQSPQKLGWGFRKRAQLTGTINQPL